MQFLFALKGPIHIDFSRDHIVTLGEGDAMMISGGVNRIELGEQNGAEVLEISIPAEMATENVGSPWGDREVVFNGRVASQTSGVAWWSESIRLFRIMVDVATPFSPRGNFFHA